MDLDNFLAFQRSKLQADIDGLALQDRTCIGKLENAKKCNQILGNSEICNRNANMDFPAKVADPAVAAAGESQSQVVTTGACTKSSMATSGTSPMHRQHNVQDVDTENNVFQICDNLGRKYRELSEETTGNSKAAKNLVNLTERQSADASANDRKLHKTKDEMEQWVSDTFYSYFPGYNNENKKRQDILRDRQLEYQQNFLKHQMIEAAANNGKKKHPHRYSNENAENTENATKTPHTSRSDKTELEIIVNNPDYEAKSPRPGSARHKLLQDLKHTELSNIVNSDGVTDRNRRNAESEIAKKKDYQKELMAQIEEKRRSIEALKEKERRQEEALTRKLQEQLRTIRLEEELEKEKMRADKVRFDSEQNRLMREHLLTKLENDAKLLLSTRKTRSENDKVVPAEKNKVYKYFSNSARNEYKRGAEVEPPAFHLDLPPSSGRHKECFHSSENTCPFCISPLKNYENWCLQCERRLPEPLSEVDSGNLICENCKKKYSFCGNCEKSNENCKHSQRKRGPCANCRRSLCSDCIESIAAAKSRKKSESERSFQILEVNYPEESDDDSNNNTEHTRPPYSMNIGRNSIFHHSFNRSKLFDDENNIESIRQETDKRLSRYLKNYGDLASKALRDRSTQTTPDSASRRDVVMVEENNLSMPLLREMPRMTRKESNLQQAERKKKGTRIENLSRRWEVPAVQKHTITTNSPKVLTQLGAIRKQLQSEQLQLDY